MKKKLVALMLVSSLAFPLCTQASSYQEAEKASMAKAIEKITTLYDGQIASMRDDSHMDVSVSLDDAGRALLGMGGTDFSWVDEFRIKGDSKIEGDRMGGDFELLLNGEQICTMEVCQDSDGTIYTRIPEIADGYLKSSEDDVSVDGMQILTPAAPAVAFSMSGMKDKLPSPEKLADMLERYMSILTEKAKETNSNPDTLTVSGISQDCTMYESEISAAEWVDAIKSILTVAKTDEDLKGVIDGFGGYDGFSDLVDDTLVQLEDLDPPASASLVSKIWAADDGTVIARSVGTKDQTFVSWESLKDGDNVGYRLSISAAGDTLELTGSGTDVNDSHDGTYELTLNSQPCLSFDVSGFDMGSDGSLTGSCELSFLPGIGDSYYEMLSGISLKATMSENADSKSVSLGVNSSGVSLATIQADTSAAKEDVEIVDVSTIDKIYDMETEDGMSTFETEVANNIGVIIEKLSSAGMPDGFLEGLIESSDTESGLTGYDYIEDGDTFDEENDAYIGSDYIEDGYSLDGEGEAYVDTYPEISLD